MSGIRTLIVVLGGLFAIVGCASDDPNTRLGPEGTVTGATRFDHFTITNMHDQSIKAIVKLWERGTTDAITLPTGFQTIIIGSGQVRGLAWNRTNATDHEIIKAECTITRIGTTPTNPQPSCTLVLPGNTNLIYTMNSVSFFFNTHPKPGDTSKVVTGQALCIDRQGNVPVVTAHQ